jgi:hypothetical protein
MGSREGRTDGHCRHAVLCSACARLLATRPCVGPSFRRPTVPGSWAPASAPSRGRSRAQREGHGRPEKDAPRAKCGRRQGRFHATVGLRAVACKFPLSDRAWSRLSVSFRNKPRAGRRASRRGRWCAINSVPGWPGTGFTFRGLCEVRDNGLPSRVEPRSHHALHRIAHGIGVSFCAPRSSVHLNAAGAG